MKKTYILVLVTVSITALYWFIQYRGLISEMPSGISNRTNPPKLPDNFEAPNIAVAPKTDIEQTDLTSSVNVQLFRYPPYDMYAQYIESANDGDPDAQFRISVVLDECSSFMGIGSVEELDELRSNGDLSVEISEYLQPILIECAELYNLLGQSDLGQLQKAWIETAASNGHPIAQLKSAFNYPELPSLVEAQDMLVKALSYRADEPIEKEESISLGALFHTYYLEVEGDRISDPIEGNAWDLLYCQKDNRCNRAEIERILDDHYFDYEVKETIQRATELDIAINNKDWTNIGLRTEENFP